MLTRTTYICPYILQHNTSDGDDSNEKGGCANRRHIPLKVFHPFFGLIRRQDGRNVHVVLLILEQIDEALFREFEQSAQHVPSFPGYQDEEHHDQV